MEQYRFSDEERRNLEALRVPLAVYQFINRRVVTLLVSDGFVDLFRFPDRASAIDLMDNDMYRDTHPDDIARVADAALRFATEDGEYNVIYRTRANSGSVYMNIHAMGEHVFTPTGERLAYVWYTNEGEYTDEASGGALNQSLNAALREQGLYRRANYDYLTGLPNMTQFFALAEAGYRDYVERKVPPVLLYIDLNGMKYFNAKYGFAEGDKLIRAFAELLTAHFGDQHCGRFGQDHFAVFTEEPGIEDRLKAIFEENERLNGGQSLPMRVGLYPGRLGYVGASTACDRAKAACDADRKSGMSHYTFYSEAMRERLENRQYILDNIDRAIAEGWIKVYYQPIIRAANGRVCDEEALARWIDPVKGMLSPAEFIPTLEEARLIYKLDLCVVDQVLAKIKRQAEAGLYVVPISVNLSRADFDSCDIVEEISRRVDASGIGRDKLTIEVTESIVGGDFEFMKAQIERFRASGFCVWMDDFGSGYSSLDVLQSIHFDLIKLDMRFMQQFDRGSESAIILTETVKMAISLGSETVCEGVETEEQAEFLREIGCTKLQGFHYCRPIPVEAVFARYEDGTAIGFENPDESAYYAAIGRINLYDMALIAGEGEDDLRKRYFDALPTAILEVRGNISKYVRCNNPYRDFMERMFGVIVIGVEYDYSALTEGPGSSFMKAVVQCGQDGNRAIVDERMADGSIVHSFIRRIAVNPVTDTVAIAVAVLAVSEQGENVGASFADIARSLSADYVHLYYVDLETEKFVEYSSSAASEDLALERHGEDFFAASRRDALDHLYKDDVGFFVEAFTKENVLRSVDEHGTFTITYRLLVNGAPVYVNMKAVRMKADDSHIIIGVNNVDAQMKEREAMERVKAERITYARITALSGDYICIYTVDPVTDRFIEYSATHDYAGLGLSKGGEGFFENAVRESARVVHEEDYVMFNSMFTKANVMSEIERNGLFSMQYRLVMDGEPVYVSAKAAMVQEADGPQLIIGVLNIDAQVKREQEYAQKLSAARSRVNLDGLTGVKNRTAYESVAETLNHQIEEGQPIKYAIVLCDVAGLAVVNETMGRRAGDNRIKEACAVVCETFKHSPVFRVAGDEFAVIAQGHDYECIDELMASLDDHNAQSLKDGGAVIAAGMSKYDGNGNVASVFARADALRRASRKALGTE